MHRRSRHGTIQKDTPAPHARTDRQTNGEGRPKSVNPVPLADALPRPSISVPARHACPRVAWEWGP